MKLKLALGSLIIGFAGVISAMANPQVVMQDLPYPGGYQFSANAELKALFNDDAYVVGLSKTAGADPLFGSFCVESDEFFNPGQTYDVVINNMAWNGGSNTNSGDFISQGTALLFSKFVLGTMAGNAGFIYGNGTASDDLQKAIWYLEDESTGSLNAAYTTYLIGAFGSIANAKLDYTGIHVKVMNLTQNGNLKQDQLVYVPDGGMTAMLLGLGLLGLGLAKRRL